MSDALTGPVLGVDLDRLQRRVWEALRARPAGVGEYELFGILRRAGEESFDRSVFGDKLAMFRSHFLLFHVLYRLRDELLAQRQGDVDIDCLRICLLPYQPMAADPLPLQRDPLRTYYEDLGNLSKTTRDDVEDMLAGFWRAFANRQQRAQALEVLALQEPVDASTIKRRYRRLALEHHPDRGGDEQKLKRINAAMAVLKP